MASNFDADSESETLVKMFRDECFPLGPRLAIERAECQKKMTDEINTLSADQMRAVGLKLERRPTDSIGVEILMDSDAHVTGFAFRNADTWSHGLFARHKNY